jgi:hypothetical protein
MSHSALSIGWDARSVTVSSPIERTEQGDGVMRRHGRVAFASNPIAAVCAEWGAPSRTGYAGDHGGTNGLVCVALLPNPSLSRPH